MTKLTTTGWAPATIAQRMHIADGDGDLFREIFAAAAADPHMLSMARGIPAPEGFPVDLIRDATGALLDQLPESAQYSATEGVPQLREQLAALIDADASEILVTAGSQQGLDLTARVLVEPGDTVAMDDPGYLGAVGLFQLYQADIAPLRTDDEGTDTEEFAQRLAGGLRPKLVYTVPNFHNPTGVTLSLARRRQLAELADQYGFWIVEDDPYGALRWRGEQLPSIAQFSDRTIRLTSLSKLLFPGFRLAGLSAPPALRPYLLHAKHYCDLHANTWGQLLAARVLADQQGLHRHLQALRGLYAEKAAWLSHLLTRDLGDQLSGPRR